MSLSIRRVSSLFFLNLMCLVFWGCLEEDRAERLQQIRDNANQSPLKVYFTKDVDEAHLKVYYTKTSPEAHYKIYKARTSQFATCRFWPISDIQDADLIVYVTDTSSEADVKLYRTRTSTFADIIYYEASGPDISMGNCPHLLKES